MALTAYKSYRLSLTKSSGTTQPSTYYTVNELQLFTGLAGAGTQVLTGGTPSASGVYGGQTADKAFDGNLAAYWESSTGPTAWLRYDLAVAVAVKSMRLASTTYPAEAPRDFLLQGSNDAGATWTTIQSFTDFLLTAGDKTVDLNLFFGGTAVTPSGSPIAKVRVFDWATGAVFTDIVPSIVGAWQLPVSVWKEYGILYIGPAGFRPQVDGPVYPFLLS